MGLVAFVKSQIPLISLFDFSFHQMYFELDCGCLRELDDSQGVFVGAPIYGGAEDSVVFLL